MQAVRVHETGGPDVLTFEEVEAPQPGEGEVLIDVVAAGLNFIDTYQRSGVYTLDLPVILGGEGAGTVAALGAGVDRLQEGERVAWAMASRSYAQQAVVAAEKLVPVPEGVDLDVAAAVLLQGMTAHYLSHSTYVLDEEDTALVTAAAGGVGHLLVQLAKRRGARVIATVSTAEKEELARKAGADEAVRYRDVDLVDEVRSLTDGAGVDVVYDSVGRDTFHKSLQVLRPRGMLVLYGQSSGPVGEIDPQLLNRHGSLFMTRPSLGAYTATRDELEWRAGVLFDLIAGDELEVRIDRRFPLSDAADAHRYIESGATRGKVLLVP